MQVLYNRSALRFNVLKIDIYSQCGCDIFVDELSWFLALL